MLDWQTATYGKMEYCEDEDDCFTNFESDFPAIVLDDTLTASKALSWEPTVSPLNNNEIDFKISFDESDDEDYIVIFDENSFSYKIVFVDNLKTNSENENDKVNMPSSSSPKPTISYIDDLDFFKDFEKEFPTIAYNDDLKIKSDPLNEPSLRIPNYRQDKEQKMMKLDHHDPNALDSIRQWKKCCFYGFIMSFYYGNVVAEKQSLDEEIFTSVAWIRAFNINEPIYVELCHGFYSTYKFDEVCVDDELQTKKIVKFRLGGRAHILTLLEHQNGYANVAWLIARWMKRKGAGTQRESQIFCRQFISKIVMNCRVLTEDVDLYDRIGRIEICQEAIERMEYIQSYHWD
nr:hypothetical protein [Tanacetum cinerariifolium]